MVGSISRWLGLNWAESGNGLMFFLPPEAMQKDLSVVEVGPFNEAGVAQQINDFMGTRIDELNRINTYLLVHPKGISGLESLVQGKPFVDPIIHRATLNRPLAFELGLPFDYVLQSMLNPGTSDAEGDTALRQALLSLGVAPSEGDIGFYSKQYLLKGRLSSAELEEVSKFLANPDLNTRAIIPRRGRQGYVRGRKIMIPIVNLGMAPRVEEYDIANMSEEELMSLNSTRKLAASLEEMLQFSEMYRDKEFIRRRKEFGLGEKATDVEIETWFGLRSEHCFHKEFNARITLDDKLGDPVFRRAFEKGWLSRDEHGRYVLERGLFKTFVEEPAKGIYSALEKRGKNWIASMFKDNSGVVYYNENYMFCIKLETHNSPSNKEPVQGAKTGIDGVNRDIFGTILGSFDALANFFYYCTGNPHYKGWLPKGVKHPFVLLKGVTQGVREGGNEMQIPTLGGGLLTDPRFIAKILVYAGTVGWSPVRNSAGKSLLSPDPRVGDIIWVAGQDVGVDGIHGATESSLSASAKISLGHVQADFSFIQAKLKEYIKESGRDLLFSAITDCGAMGIGSATHELAQNTGGLVIDLALHPRKYEGIWPWQVNCSETQDRMVFTSRKEDKEELLRRAKLHDVKATPLGELNDSGYINLKYKDKTVGLLDIKKLFNKEPRKQMSALWDDSLRASEHEKPLKNKNYSLQGSISLVLSQPDVASKEWFFRQKDSVVKGATIQGPLIGLKQEVEADATIQKPLDTEGKDFGAIAYSLGIAPKLSDIDPYLSSQRAFVDMVGKIIAIGGALPDMKNPKWDAWAVCGNYCQPNSESRDTLIPESGARNLASLVREGIGVREAIEELNIPVISGKDSMKCSCVYDVDESFKLEDVPLDLRKHINLVEDKESGKRKIEIHDPPTYLASAAVKIDDYRKCVDSAFKQGGDMIYILGETKNHLGASQFSQATGYFEQGAPLTGGEGPKVDFEQFKGIAGKIHEAINQEIVASCSYIHNGGLAAALVKAAIAGEKGANINLGQVRSSGCSLDEELLFSETPGRFIVTVAGKDKDEFEKLMAGTPYGLIGIVSYDKNKLRIIKKDSTPEVVSLRIVKKYYQAPLRFDLDQAASKGAES